MAIAQADQVIPLTFAWSPQNTSTTDEENGMVHVSKHPLKHNRCIKCCGCCTAALLSITVVVIVLAFTVFHVKDPQIWINGVTIGDVKYISGTIIPDPSANITIDVHVSVKNPNFVSFRYDNGTTTLFYHKTKVGESKTPAGVAKARRTGQMNLSLKLVTARMLGEEEALGSEIRSGAMIISSYTYLDGRVKILGAFKKSVNLRMNCTVTVNTTSMQLQGQNCVHKLSF
ncbi:hypothetical protein Syun_019222 [Stephania yunnanensis]|uniref:Late embryogenesis abundant protein LEA-2 subgroup domain-containing protein n=1 Tax=Stephania yunnanensis TaxID=152371 RepID=A0AAP0IUW0_9MAGN